MMRTGALKKGVERLVCWFLFPIILIVLFLSREQEFDPYETLFLGLYANGHDQMAMAGCASPYVETGLAVLVIERLPLSDEIVIRGVRRANLFNLGKPTINTVVDLNPEIPGVWRIMVQRKHSRVQVGTLDTRGTSCKLQVTDRSLL